MRKSHGFPHDGMLTKESGVSQKPPSPLREGAIRVPPDRIAPAMAD